MGSARDILVKVNPLILPATVLGTFRYADWRGAQKRGGAVGILVETASSVVGTNTEPFFIPESSGWRISDVEALLMRHGIRLWGVGSFNGELFFRVKKRQAHWAQYVMLRAGVPLVHGLLDGSRANPQNGYWNPDGADTRAPRADRQPAREEPTGFERLLDQIAGWFD